MKGGCRIMLQKGEREKILSQKRGKEASMHAFARDRNKEGQ
jgi:hypothetical protein